MKNFSILSSCRRLEEDAASTTQQGAARGVIPFTTLQRVCCGSVTTLVARFYTTPSTKPEIHTVINA